MHLKKLLMYMFAAGMVASCTNDELLPENDGNANSVENVVFTIEDWKTEPETRTTIQFGGYSLWNSRYYNQICVVPNVSDSNGKVAIQFPLSSLTTPGPANQSASTLSTTANSGWDMKNGVEYIAYYPSYSGSTSSVSFQLDIPSASQSNTFNFDMANDMMYAKAKATSSSISFNFQRKYALIGLYLTNLPSDKWRSVTLSNSKGNAVFNRAGTLNVISGVVTPNNERRFSSYTIYNPIVSNKTIKLLLPTLPTTTGELSCVLVDEYGNRYETTFPSKDVKEGYFECFYFSEWTQNTFENGHEFVNLGLPSGLKWATMNVGATKVTDSGDFFSWGEIEPHVGEYISISSYKWWDGGHDAHELPTMNKYYSDVDNKTLLDLEDDAAHANWGGKWRMPTGVEMQELIDNCFWHWTEHFNGSNTAGWIVFKAKRTSDKGDWSNSETLTRGYSLSDTHIFIPAVRYAPTGTQLSGLRGKEGEYWLSTLYEDVESMGQILSIWNCSITVNSRLREKACAVRAVCKRN